MKLTNEMTHKTHKTPRMNLQDFRITYATRAIRIKLKFQGVQTLNISYPRELDPAKTGAPYHCITEHLMEAANYWCQAVVNNPNDVTFDIMYRRAKIAQAYLEKYIEQETGKGWK